MDTSTGKQYVVNNQTGEVMDGIVTVLPAGTISYTPEQQEAYKQRKATEELKRLQESVKAAQSSELGHYYYACADKEYCLSPATLARLIYLCTFLHYDCETLYISQRKKLHIRDLPDVLGLSRNTVKTFLAEAVQYITVLENGELCVRADSFCRGALPHGKHISFQRVYINAVSPIITMFC